jgi:rubrerythrin
MDRMSSIEFAYKNEQTEMDYYLKQAERSRNDVVKRLFETLASDEREHMQIITSLHERLVADGAWPQDVPIRVGKTSIGYILDQLPRNKHFQVEHDADDMTALKTAIDFEENGIKFYKELAGKCENPQERQFFDFLAEMEREHFLSIQDSILFLEDPATWFATKEHSGLE